MIYCNKKELSKHLSSLINLSERTIYDKLVSGLSIETIISEAGRSRKGVYTEGRIKKYYKRKGWSAIFL